MSHFLARLVQRTRGEISTVRPVISAVTAPDPTAAAWDEQVVTREAAPLAAAPQAPTGRHRPPSIDLAFADPGDEEAMTGEGPHRGVPTRHVIRDVSMVTWSATPATSPGAPATSPDAPATSLGAPATSPGAPATSLGAPAASPDAPAASPGALAASPGAPAASPGAPTASPDALAMPPTPRIPDSADPARGAPASRALPSAAARAALTATTLASHPIASPRSSAIARTPIASFAALEPHAMPSDPPARPAAREAAATTPTPAALLGRAPRPVAPPSAGVLLPAHADAAARWPVPRHGLAGHAAPAGLVQETATTVEVSIGRVEVRLPPRPAATGRAAPSSTRRPVVGLAEYLRARETGKAP